MPDAALRIRDALSGKYDAPIRLDPAANRADTHASGGHADALQPAILLRLPTGDERVSTAEEEQILRKAQQIVARRLAVRQAEKEAREAERRQLEAPQEEEAPLAMQQDEPTAQAPATDPRTLLPPTHSLYIPPANPDNNPNVAMNPQRAQDEAAARKWYTRTQTHTHTHTHTHTQEHGRPVGGSADTSHSSSGSRRRGCSYFGRA